MKLEKFNACTMIGRKPRHYKKRWVGKKTANVFFALVLSVFFSAEIAYAKNIYEIAVQAIEEGEAGGDITNSLYEKNEQKEIKKKDRISVHMKYVGDKQNCKMLETTMSLQIAVRPNVFQPTKYHFLLPLCPGWKIPEGVVHPMVRQIFNQFIAQQ